MAGNRTVRFPKLMVGLEDVATKFTAQDAHAADVAKHREIDDAATGITDLWSGSKINTELSGKVDSPFVPGTDIPVSTITAPMLDISNAETDTYVLAWDAGAGKFTWVERALVDGSNLTLADASVTEAMLLIDTAAGVGVDDYSLVWDNALGRLDYQERLKVDASNMTAGSVTEPMLDVLDSPADTEVLAWNAASGQFEWITHTTGGAASYQVKWDAGGAASYLEDKVPVIPAFAGNAGKLLVLDAAETDMEWTQGIEVLTSGLNLYLASTGNDVTGDGSILTPWKTIGRALEHLANKRISADTLVTINLAAGTYTALTAEVINHPDSDRLQIVGAGQATTVLQFSAAGISIDGHSLKKLSDLTIEAASNIGLYVDNGGHAYVYRVTFNASLVGIKATMSSVEIVECDITSVSVGVVAEQSQISFTGASTLIDSCGNGMTCDRNGCIYSTGLIVSNCTSYGVTVNNASVVLLISVTLTGNANDADMSFTTTGVPNFGNIGSWIYKS